MFSEKLNEFYPFIIDSVYLPKKNIFIKMYLIFCNCSIELNYLKEFIINLNMRSLLDFIFY